jgi:hypothetical protein
MTIVKGGPLLEHLHAPLVPNGCNHVAWISTGTSLDDQLLLLATIPLNVI